MPPTPTAIAALIGILAMGSDIAIRLILLRGILFQKWNQLPHFSQH